MRYRRRDTIAYMPQTFEMLKFADEMDLEDSAHRSLSQIEVLPAIDSDSDLFDLFE